MAAPVIKVASGGLLVTEVPNGLPLTPTQNFGFPVTVGTGGVPVTFVDDEAWYMAPQYSGMAAIADINNDRYAITQVPLGQIATASVVDLTKLRPATREEWFAQYTASSTTARTYVDASGSLKNDLPANAARFDYTNGKRQLLLENQGTNVLRNNTFQGGTVGTTTLPTNFSVGNNGGLAVTLINKGEESGVDYADFRVNGTSTQTTTFFIELDSQSAASAVNAAWTMTAYMKRVTGAPPALMFDVVQRGSTDNYVADAFIPLPLTDKLERLGGAVITSHASVTQVRGRITFASTTGTAYDFTVRIGLPQLEQSPFASAPIKTSGAAVTRAIESFRLPPIVEAILQRDQGGVVARFDLTATEGARRIVGFDSARSLCQVSGGVTTVSSYNGVNSVGGAVGSGSTLDPMGISMAFDTTGRAICGNGGTVWTDTNQPGARTSFWLGRADVVAPSVPYADGRYDFLGILASRPTNTWHQEMTVVA